jgi:hypothetical protein
MRLGYFRFHLAGGRGHRAARAFPQNATGKDGGFRDRSLALFAPPHSSNGSLVLPATFRNRRANLELAIDPCAASHVVAVRSCLRNTSASSAHAWQRGFSSSAALIRNPMANVGHVVS